MRPGGVPGVYIPVIFPASLITPMLLAYVAPVQTRDKCSPWVDKLANTILCGLLHTCGCRVGACACLARGQPPRPPLPVSQHLEAALWSRCNWSPPQAGKRPLICPVRLLQAGGPQPPGPADTFSLCHCFTESFSHKGPGSLVFISC